MAAGVYSAKHASMRPGLGSPRIGTRRHGATRLRLPRFNEAGAWEPPDRLIRPTVSVAWYLASMRPGLGSPRIGLPIQAAPLDEAPLQ